MTQKGNPNPAVLHVWTVYCANWWLSYLTDIYCHYYVFLTLSLLLLLS